MEAGKFCLREEPRDAKDLVHRTVVFPKVIKKRAIFLDITRNGATVRTKGVVTVCRKLDSDISLVGYTASRKVGTAVVRNFAKRRLRYLVREFCDKILPGYAFVFIATTSTTAMKFADLKLDFLYALKKFKCCKRKHVKRDFYKNDKTI